MTDEELRLHLESLHSNIAELTENTQRWIARVEKLDNKERKAREAIMNGIATYFRIIAESEEE